MLFSFLCCQPHSCSGNQFLARREECPESYCHTPGVGVGMHVHKIFNLINHLIIKPNINSSAMKLNTFTPHVSRITFIDFGIKGQGQKVKGLTLVYWWLKMVSESLKECIAPSIMELARIVSLESRKTLLILCAMDKVIDFWWLNIVSK